MSDISDDIGRVVYRCLEHRTVMKPVKIECKTKGAYVHLRYELEICSECIKKHTPIMFTVEPKEASND